MAAYAAPADMSARYDDRILKDLVSDSGTAATDLSTNANILAALEDASGRLESACFVSGLYSTDQLNALTGNNLALRKRIVCELAMAYLMVRRPEKYNTDGYAKAQEVAEQFLDMIRKGLRIFAVDAVIEAGMIDTDGPSAVAYERLNLLPDRTQNYYPHRASRLPIGRG